ncbi:MAG: bifunctional DNA primase/polymerase [Thaumarchaeota archaeon]|nr:bifunctional DNA primase/polymerase [Nitrososphaerota archaeon]
MNRSDCISVLKEQNLNLIPLKEKEKTPSISWKDYQTKKYEGVISENENLAVVCGPISGNLVVVDIDTNDESLLDKVLPDACNRTLVVKTGKGYHVYTKTEKLPKTLRLENHVGKIDVQSEGTYVVGPTSTHPTGAIYEVVSTTTRISTIDFQEIIENLEKMGFEPARTTNLIVVERNGAKEGSRNDSMFRLSRKYLTEYDEATAWAVIQTVNDKNKPPLDLKELQTLFESAKKYSDNTSENEFAESTTLYDFAMSKIKKLVISQNNSNEVYAIIENNGHTETLNLSSKRAIQWLNYNYHNENKSANIRGEEFYKNVLTAIISHAQMNGTKRENINTRLSLQNEELYYDLATPDWKAVKVTKDEIKLVDLDENTPLFRRTQSLYTQVQPDFSDYSAIKKLSELLYISEQDRQVFEVHVIAMFLESIPVPVMVFGGEAGSMKSTATSTIKRIVDPSGAKKDDNLNSMSPRNDDLIIQLYNRYASPFDNVTKITQETSDILCRAITGGNNSKRELYTNSEETILCFMRKIILNGIVPSLDYPDLQERILSYNRIQLDDNTRLTEGDFENKFAKLLPFVLGNIFMSIQKAMQLYDIVRQEIRPRTRLADFEMWGESISRVLGYEKNLFVSKYIEKQKEMSFEAKESHPVVAAIEEIMNERNEYEDTASRLFNSLKERSEGLGIDTKSVHVRFPKAPNQLTRELKILIPILKKIGIEVTMSHYTKNDGKYKKNTQIVTIRRLAVTSPPSIPDSPLEKYVQN